MTVLPFLSDVFLLFYDGKIWCFSFDRPLWRNFHVPPFQFNEFDGL
jgi:hypothetical protein